MSDTTDPIPIDGEPPLSTAERIWLRKRMADYYHQRWAWKRALEAFRGGRVIAGTIAALVAAAAAAWHFLLDHGFKP